MSSAERYVFGEEIARGGMGAILRATDTALGREVAVKVLLDKYAPESGTARRFADEARITGGLQHPGIPPVHDLGTLADGRPFLAMKLIKGDTLDDLLKTRRDPADDRGRFVAVFEAVCQAVAYAHAHDVVHRDLKPANVMVGKFGEVQVMDWGVAKVLRPGGAADGAVADPDATAPNTEVRSLRDVDGDHTKAGAVMGTPAYMPPEQAAGAAHKVTPRSDVFGLGAVLAVILTGRPPFEAGPAETVETAEAVRVKAAQGDVGDCLSRLDACGAEPELVALCERCLSPRPPDRPAHAGEVAAAVADFRAQSEARARQAELDRVQAEGDRATAEAMAAEGRKRRRVQLVLAAAVVLLVAGTGAVAVWRVDEQGKKRTEALRQEGVENQRRQAERERKARAADAVGDLLDRMKAALEAGDSARAAPLLAQADRRAIDDAVADHANRRSAYTRDLAMLRALDGVSNFQWTLLESSSLPSPERVAELWATAYAEYGIVPGTTQPVEAVARMNESPIRPALVAGLDGWLARSKSVAVRDILAAADPNPFRDEVRQRLAIGDTVGLVGLAGRPEWPAQPSGLVLAYGGSPAVPAEVEQKLLLRFAIARRTDFALLMQLGRTYPINTPNGLGERVRCYQAAAALRPENTIALNNLGIVLRVRRDLGGAEAAFREAIRLDPKLALPHNGLGNVLRDRKDLGGAEAAYLKAIGLDPKLALPHIGLGSLLRARKDLGGAEAAYCEAIRLDPKLALPHYDLGNVLYDRKDLGGAEAAYCEAIRLDPRYASAHNNLGKVLYDRRDLGGAETAFREAIRLDPKLALPHNGLGTVLYAKGDPDGAAVAYSESIRLDPNDTIPHNNLGVAYESRLKLDLAEACYREAIRLNPRNALAHANLGNTLRKQARHADAVTAYREALVIQPPLGYAREGLAYCLRVQRGEVPTAPPPRPAAR